MTSHDCALRLNSPHVMHERLLQKRWLNLQCDIPYTLENGATLRILAHGLYNTEYGPDFLNATLEIDGKSHIGDVQLHPSTLDWTLFGHEHNIHFQNVILCAVLHNESASFPHALYCFETETSSASFTLSFAHEPLMCHRLLSTQLSPEQMRHSFSDYATQRFILHATHLTRMIVSSGVEKTLWRACFATMGQGQNRVHFLRILSRFLTYDQPLRHRAFETLLWGESDLSVDQTLTDIPDELNRAFLESRKAEFTYLRKQHRGTHLDYTRKRCRPTSTPERQLAALCMLLKIWKGQAKTLLEWYHEPLPPSVALHQWVERLTVQDPFYDGFIGFSYARSRPKAIIGTTRAYHLLANAILPFLYAYAMREQDHTKCEAIMTMYRLIPALDSNSILKRAKASCLGEGLTQSEPYTFKSLYEQQGLQYIYTYFCAKNETHCVSCPLRAIIEKGEKKNDL